MLSKEELARLRPLENDKASTPSRVLTLIAQAELALDFYAACKEIEWSQETIFALGTDAADAIRALVAKAETL